MYYVFLETAAVQSAVSDRDVSERLYSKKQQ